LTIEPARSEDAEAIAALDAVAWSGGAHPERVPDGEHVWRIWLDGAFVLVARESGELVGAIVAFPVRSGELFVHKLMVAGTHRRHGIGTRLFEALLDEIDAVSGAACFLTVDPSHADAVRRYEALGFTQKEYVSGFYRDDEDRWVMRRPSAARAGTS
jgi:ribosomal protein S18 acetylase RimI-like enzyme